MTGNKKRSTWSPAAPTVPVTCNGDTTTILLVPPQVPKRLCSEPALHPTTETGHQRPQGCSPPDPVQPRALCLHKLPSFPFRTHLGGEGNCKQQPKRDVLTTSSPNPLQRDERTPSHSQGKERTHGQLGLAHVNQSLAALCVSYQ